MRIAMEVGILLLDRLIIKASYGSVANQRRLGPWIPQLIAGMRGYGIADTFIEQLVGQLKGFAEYGFPESHAASFALLAYASSYLKCHHPAAFT